MKLYHAPGACSLADHIALIESQLPFSAERVDLKTKTTESGDDYRAINPKGYVPALALDGGAILTENIAILTHIADKAGGLIPRGELGQVRALEALAYISTELHKGFKPFFAPNSSEADKAGARELLTRRFALFEDKLKTQEFVLDDAFGVADCYLFVMLFWASTKAGITLAPGLQAYYERLKDRPSIAQALTDEGLTA